MLGVGKEVLPQARTQLFGSSGSVGVGRTPSGSRAAGLLGEASSSSARPVGIAVAATEPAHSEAGASSEATAVAPFASARSASARPQSPRGRKPAAPKSKAAAAKKPADAGRSRSSGAITRPKSAARARSDMAATGSTKGSPSSGGLTSMTPTASGSFPRGSAASLAAETAATAAVAAAKQSREATEREQRRREEEAQRQRRRAAAQAVKRAHSASASAAAAGMRGATQRSIGAATPREASTGASVGASASVAEGASGSASPLASALQPPEAACAAAGAAEHRPPGACADAQKPPAQERRLPAQQLPAQQQMQQQEWPAFDGGGVSEEVVPAGLEPPTGLPMTEASSLERNQDTFELAKAWCSRTVMDPAEARVVTYPNGVSVNIFDLTSEICALGISPELVCVAPAATGLAGSSTDDAFTAVARRRARLEEAVVSGSAARCALRIYQDTSAEMSGILAWTNEGIRTFVARVLAAEGISQLNAEQLHRAHRHFDGGRRQPLDALSAVCLGDTLLRVALRVPLPAVAAARGDMPSPSDSQPLSITGITAVAAVDRSFCDPLPEDISRWTPDDTARWAVEVLGLQETLGHLLAGEEISGKVLLRLCEDDLERIGVAPFGRRRQLLLGIRSLRATAGVSEAEAASYRNPRRAATPTPGGGCIRAVRAHSATMLVAPPPYRVATAGAPQLLREGTLLQEGIGNMGTGALTPRAPYGYAGAVRGGVTPPVCAGAAAVTPRSRPGGALAVPGLRAPPPGINGFMSFGLSTNPEEELASRSSSVCVPHPAVASSAPGAAIAPLPRVSSGAPLYPALLPPSGGRQLVHVRPVPMAAHVGAASGTAPAPCAGVFATSPSSARHPAGGEAACGAAAVGGQQRPRSLSPTMCRASTPARGVGMPVAPCRYSMPPQAFNPGQLAASAAFPVAAPPSAREAPAVPAIPPDAFAVPAVGAAWATVAGGGAGNGTLLADVGGSSK